jgi:hypothetical protein
MPMPGAGDSYFYEWYVGLKNVIKMLNSNSDIRCVIFQRDEYDTIDDVVVEYTNDTVQMCYQVKHNIETAAPKSLTFGSMLESSGNKKCLLEAIFQGWKQACATSTPLIKPVLFTNRKVHNRRSGRHINGKTYSAYPIDQFVSKMQTVIAETETGASLAFSDDALECQWEELCSVLSTVDPNELASFLKVFQIQGNERNLEEMKRSLLSALCDIFSCEDSVALELFGRLLVGLTEWTTTGRKSREVMIEDVYSVLAIGEDVDENQHRLVYPYPFFESRRFFCKTLVKQIKETVHKVVFLSGEPGSGKTSTISFLQSEYNLFLLRYHTFRPISPEQHFYNADPGVCTAENLWGTLLIQLRKRLKNRLAELHVPVSNKLLSVEEMRSHVMRLLGVLGQEAMAVGKKEYICIDGIDHAARANIPVTFLTSLPLPSEIPDGVCFVLAGQPAAMYQDQYPQWLSNGTEIECISMPKLGISDIKQLILARADQFTDATDELANLIFQKTDGNNLSTVFAVEEIKVLRTLEIVVAKLQQSCIGGDIQQYYNHIWAHMKAELSKIMGNTIFPESIVACPILLMNGRVNTRILAAALNYGMSHTEWNMLLDRLYPLVIRVSDDGEYALFHNDFRVFLMGIVSSYQARYEEIALLLAKYLLQHNEGILSYVTGIPLLQCARREELIPQYFTAEFVINALAEGISYVRLDEFAHLSYDAACKNRDYVGYRNTYLAVKTLYQHKQYFEYYEKEYKTVDNPEISTIDIAEVRALPIRHENLDEFNRVLSLCGKLYSSDKEEHKERALRLYHKWFHEYSPISFVSLCADTVSEDNAWKLKSTEVGFFLQHWGTIAAEIDIPVPDVNEDLSDSEWYAVLSFSEQYFTYCIQHQKYDLAINAMKAGYVNQRTFAEKLEDIYYAGTACEFSGALTRVEQSAENPTWNLLALSMKATCDPTFQPNRSVLETTPAVKRIYDQSSFTLVLKAFLLGCIEKSTDDETLVSHSNEYCTEIEGGKTEKEQAIMLARVSALLGKYYWVADHQSTMFEGYSEWLLSATLSRSLDYMKARRFLLYTLVKSKAVQSIERTKSFIEALQVSLFKIDSFGMFYKTCILDFLVEQNRHDIIKEYIDGLYGNNCCKISLEEQKADMHEHFRPYSELVEPELMQQFTEQLKWDVVGYSGYKEYALQAPLDCFEAIATNDPSRWKDLGMQLYNQSKIADLYNNHYAYDIENCITEAATMCGIADYWELRCWSDEFRAKPDYIHNALLWFIKTASGQKELQAIWILCCGIHSWYTQSERLDTKSIYDACIRRAHEMDIDFTSFVSQVTPEWESIVTHLADESNSLSEGNASNSGSSEKMNELTKLYDSLSVDESLDYLKTVERSRWATDHYLIVLEKILTSNENVQEHLTQFLCSFGVFLQGKEWTYERFDQIITPLLSKLGSDAFWVIAESNGTQLSDYDYQTSTRNMQLLFKLMCHENLAEMELLLKEELHTQQMWVSGNNHFSIKNDCERTVATFANTPQSITEMAFYILLEQADVQNARKLETAIYAIYLLGAQFPEIISTIIEQWTSFSDTQEECLLMAFVRWSAEGICPKELHDFLLNIYNNCSELSRKYYLHSVLLRLYEPSVEADAVSCKAPAISYEIPEDGIADKDNCYRNFLSLIERYKGKPEADAIRKCLYEAYPLANYVEDRFANNGDSCIPVLSTYPGKIFYSKEKCGDWDEIPLGHKKAHLIPPEDPFLLTEMPHMVFDSKWFPDITVTHDGEKEPELTTSTLHHIVHSHVCDDEIVLAACLWYPLGHRDGTIYTEFSKIDIPIKMQRPIQFDSCIGNYGLLIVEEAMVESSNTTIGTGGLSLFNRLCGNFRLFFGNCQLAPSSIWQDYLHCKPKRNNPYIWESHSGQAILRFERIASPVREIMQEAYIRQPILFRWICNKTWLKTILQNEHLCIIPFAIQEPYPFEGDE